MATSRVERRRVPTSAPWASIVGYSRAVRVGDVVHVSGTAPVDGSGVVLYPDDLYRQTRRCLEIIVDALRAAGAAAEDVVRTRVYLTDITRWEEAGRAHGEVFGGARPATSFVQVAALIDPAMLVEVEAEAIVG
ncbi:MAG: RidA family protein [Longimicrobiales bacterium]